MSALVWINRRWLPKQLEKNEKAPEVDPSSQESVIEHHPQPLERQVSQLEWTSQFPEEIITGAENKM